MTQAAVVETPKTEEAPVAGAVETKKKTAPQGPDPNIIRGRMPLAIVAMIRFGNDKAEKSTTLAEMYGTTVGKIEDIKTNSNFIYVTADFKPTQVMKNEGIAHLKKHPKFNDGFVDKLINELEKTTVASEAEAAKFAEIKKAAHGQSTVKKDGTPAAAGGGNNRGKKTAAQAPVAGTTTMVPPPVISAKDLLK